MIFLTFSLYMWYDSTYLLHSLSIPMSVIIILGICLLVVCAFEFVNGMNDTANAIAPVIYSHSLQPKKSVLIAATLNFL